MMIVFVYDTSKSCKEEDDPADAVMYFHPPWVSQTQKLALAGQLMGVNKFLSTSFSSPSIISLQGGKFVLKEFGSYIIAIGTDRNIQEWILERRANILESLLKFFHCNFETILISLNYDRNKFTDKLYQIFETYLPILQYNANLFSNIPILKLPRSASNIFLEAMQILQYCQETNGVIGGALFYNNKVIASQLSADMTKQLIIIDPYRIKTPADKIETSYHLPVGSQLFRVYVEQKQLFKLIEEANMERGYSSCSDSLLKQYIHKKCFSKIGIKDQSITMKRDISRIFTVPEEAELDDTHYNKLCCIPPIYSSPYLPVKKKEEIITSKTEGLKYQYSQTPSVCSTPLKDINRVLHDFAVSIFATSDESDLLFKDNEKSKIENNKKSSYKERECNMDDIPDVVKKAVRCKRLNKFKNAIFTDKISVKYQHKKKISLSLTDIKDSLKKYSNNIVLKTYALGSPKINYIVCNNRREFNQRQFYNTISDPYYPVFRSDGLLVSQSLYDECISNNYEEFNQTSTLTEFTFDVSTNFSPKENDKLFFNNYKIDANSDHIIENSNVIVNVTLESKSKQETYRQSMSLPLKPLNDLNNTEKCKLIPESNVFNVQKNRKFDGLQLTPLMSKLSLLIDDKSNSFCSRETTPIEFCDLSSNSKLNSKMTMNNLEVVNDDACINNNIEIVKNRKTVKTNTDSFEKGQMFLCGHQNMVLCLLMEDGTADDADLIHSLWEMCINIFGCLETRLQQCLEPFPSNESKELYSVLSVDSDWDTTLRSGLWGVTELDIVSCLHNRFTCNHNLTDIIVRTDDTVVYGNQSGNVEVFYQQAIARGIIGGLPTPADLMGIVPIKAKRRLERDHMIIIL